MRQTVILAAGNGSRIGSGRHELPKPLCKVGGQQLIDHALAQAAEVGCEEAVVVVGCGADLVREHLAQVDTPFDITVVHNAQYHDPNGLSLLAAEPHVSGRFFLQMADHLFGEPVLRFLADEQGEQDAPMRLLVDYNPPHLDEEDATKVRVSADRIVEIGKTVHPWDAVDAGFFLLDDRVFDALRAAGAGEQLSVSAGMRRVADAGYLAPVALNGVGWVDIDTPDDWARAEELLCSLAGERSGSAQGALA